MACRVHCDHLIWPPAQHKQQDFAEFNLVCNREYGSFTSMSLWFYHRHSKSSMRQFVEREESWAYRQLSLDISRAVIFLKPAQRGITLFFQVLAVLWTLIMIFYTAKGDFWAETASQSIYSLLRGIYIPKIMVWIFI